MAGIVAPGCRERHAVTRRVPSGGKYRQAASAAERRGTPPRIAFYRGRPTRGQAIHGSASFFDLFPPSRV